MVVVGVKEAVKGEVVKVVMGAVREVVVKVEDFNKDNKLLNNLKLHHLYYLKPIFSRAFKDLKYRREQSRNWRD